MAKTNSKIKALLLIKKAVKARSVKKTKPVVAMSDETVGLPGFIQPTEYDLHDELVRMDSFSYRAFHE